MASPLNAKIVPGFLYRAALDSGFPKSSAGNAVRTCLLSQRLCRKFLDLAFSTKPNLYRIAADLAVLHVQLLLSAGLQNHADPLPAVRTGKFVFDRSLQQIRGVGQEIKQRQYDRMRHSIPLVITCLATLGLLGGCDSAPGASETTEEPTGPAGGWVIDPISFRLNRIVDASAGITEDIQATIEGSVNLAEAGGNLSGTGSCSWTARRHTARTGQTIEKSATEPFSVSGSVTGADARLILTGCAWNQLGYRGTFDGSSYALTIPAGAEGPLFDAAVWSDARFVEGDNPAALTLVRP